MKKNKITITIKVLLILAAIAAITVFLQDSDQSLTARFINTSTWLKMANPGNLSSAHAHLENNCSACHTSMHGVETAKCIVCHASNDLLLQRTETKFHRNIGSCVECHREHKGIFKRPISMKHADLGRIVQKSKNTTWATHKSSLMDSHYEQSLKCSACHQKKEPHLGIFGTDCIQCHKTSSWNIPEFSHPHPKSRDCVQCHIAPRSHYKKHFSKKSRMGHRISIRQCYFCHTIASWLEFNANVRLRRSQKRKQQ